MRTSSFVSSANSAEFKIRKKAAEIAAVANRN
jgi:hypothetical protein